MGAVRVDGLRIGVLEAGGGDAAPLLLVHGFTGAKEDFAPVLDGLATHRRVVAVDLPGHGESEGPDDDAAYALGATAAWVLRCADALGMGELHLLGHSLGGLVVQRVAATASQRLRSLVLMSTGLGALRPEAADTPVRIATTARDHGPEAAFLVSQEAAADAGLDPRVLADRARREPEIRERFGRLSPAALIGGARTLVGTAPFSAFLRGIDIPVLVVHGEEDFVWTPAEQALLASTVRGAELTVIADSFHSPQRENPEAWLEAVNGFLAQVDS